MIHYKLIILLILCTGALAWACQPARTSDQTVTEINRLMGVGETEEAVALAEKIMKSNKSMDTIGTVNLCRLSVVMARLAEHTERSDEFSAYALQCYRTAVERDSATASEYFAHMPTEDFQYAELLRQLMRPIAAREMGLPFPADDEGGNAAGEEADTIHG